MELSFLKNQIINCAPIEALIDFVFFLKKVQTELSKIVRLVKNTNNNVKE